MFDVGIRNGTFDERSEAALLMYELVELTNVESIQQHINKIAGALIRICSDRFPPVVKVSILKCLKLLLDKYGNLLRGFYIPLQTTFVKVIHDPNREVRYNAGLC